MKRIYLLILMLPVLAFAQLRMSFDTYWTVSGDTIVTVKYIKVPGVRVTGNVKIDGTLSMRTEATSQIKMINGTASSPALAFNADVTSGLFRNSTTGALSVSMRGGQKAAFTKSGKLSLSSANGDTSNTLYVNGDGLTTGKFTSNDTLASGKGVRTESVLRAKGVSTFGTTGTTATIGTDGKITSPDTVVSTKGIRTEGTSILKNTVSIGNGTTAAPALSFLYDAGTGLSRNATTGSMVLSERGLQAVAVTKGQRYNFSPTVADSANAILTLTRSKSTVPLLYIGNDGNATKDTVLTMLSSGNIGIGTSNPFFTESIVNGGGITTGLHLVNSTVNKNRTTAATASDSASIILQVLGSGQPILRIRAADGDTASIFADNTSLKTSTNSIIQFTSGAGYIIWNGTNFYALDDSKVLGSATSRWQDYFGTDAIYLFQKGQTPKLMLGAQNTYTEETDSCVTLKISAGNPVFTGMSGYAGQSTRQFYFGADTLALFNSAKTGRDSTIAILPSGRIVNNGVNIVNRTVSLADVGEYTLPITSTAGWGSCMIGDNVEWARFRFTAAGVVTLEANSANVGTTNDTDLKLNIYQGTNTIVFENQLGSTLTLAIVVNSYTP